MSCSLLFQTDAKLQQKTEIRKDIAMESSYNGFG